MLPGFKAPQVWLSPPTLLLYSKPPHFLFLLIFWLPLLLLQGLPSAQQPKWSFKTSIKSCPFPEQSHLRILVKSSLWSAGAYMVYLTNYIKTLVLFIILQPHWPLFPIHDLCVYLSLAETLSLDTYAAPFPTSQLSVPISSFFRQACPDLFIWNNYPLLPIIHSLILPF